MTTTLRVLHATREQWAKELSNQTIESHVILKLLKEKNRIKYGFAGSKTKWTVKFKQLELEGYADGDSLAFARKTLTKTAELNWRGYKMTDAISEQELLENGDGDTQIIDLFQSKLKQMEEDADDQFCQEFYIDGAAAGNEKRLFGIESFMSVNTGSQTSTDVFATVLNDTYAGLVTTKGNYGGQSDQDREYNFWSPVVVSTNRTTGSGSKAWATDAVESLRYGIIHTRRGVKRNLQLDLIVMSRDNYATLLLQLDSKQRQIVNEKNSIARFGFTDVVQIDGVDCTMDPDIPAKDAAGDDIRAYGFNTSQMELRVLGKKKQLWNASGDTFREDNMHHRFWIGFYGQIVFMSPRHFAKWVDLV